MLLSPKDISHFSANLALPRSYSRLKHHLSVKKFDFWTWQVFRKSSKFLNLILTKLSYIRRAGPSISTSTGTPKVQGLIKKLLYDPNGELMTPKSHMPIISKSLMTTNKKRRTRIIGH